MLFFGRTTWEQCEYNENVWEHMRTSQIIKYHPQNILSCESGLHMNAQPMSLGFGFWLNLLLAYMGGNLLTVQSFIHTHSNDDTFHDSDKTCWDGPDKMPTKNWDGQNANHNKSLDNMPTFRWHFVRTPLDSGTDHICRAFLRCDLACEVLNSKLECLNSCIDHTWTTFPQNGP